jgi:WD40 repeat protein
VLLDEEGNAYLTDFSIGRGSARTSDDLEAFAALARATLGERLPMDVGEALRRAEIPPGPDDSAAVFAEFASVLGARSDGLAAVVADVRNPYKGLRPFLEADALDFFGREAFIRRLLDRLSHAGRSSRFIAVVGPSGSGKSSAVSAGLVAALRQGAVPGSEAWFVTEMHPGHHPLEELDGALIRVAVRPPAGLLGRLESGPRGLLEVADAIVPEGTELLLIVDQFEEAFTLAEAEDDRALFLESLRVATADPASRVRVIATLRADFYDRPLRYPRMGELMGSSTEILGPLTPEELERAIVQPAEHAGLTVDRALVPQIAADVAEQPGALPLIQYALTELYDRRHDGRLTLEAYREIGGVGGALAASAEHLYASRQPGGREAIRQLFLRLVTPGEGAADTRRRVPLSELSAIEVDASAIESAVDTYGRHRLLTFDRDPSTREPTVEVAHEALLGAWERLRRWIEDARDDVRMRRRLSDAAREWERSRREPSFLLVGSRLDQFESWGSATNLALGLDERGYLSASVARRDEERAAEAARSLRERTLERRSVKRLRALFLALTAAALVAGTLTAIILNRNASAQRASSLAAGRELLAGAAKNLDVDRQLAILLAVEALRTMQGVDGNVPPEAEQVLRRAVPAVAIDTTSILGRGIRDGSLTRDGTAVALIGEDGSVGVWDLRNGSRILGRPSPDISCGADIGCPDVFSVSLSDDAHLMATGDGEGLAHVWDLVSGREVMAASTYAPPIPASRYGAVVSPIVALSPDGRLLAAVGHRGSIRMWEVSTGAQVWALAPEETDPVAAFSSTRAAYFGPDGTGLLVCSWSAAPRVLDVATGEKMISPSGTGGFRCDHDAFSADGSRVAFSLTRGDSDLVEVWDMRSRRRVASVPYPEVGFGETHVGALSPDGRVLAMAGGPEQNVVSLRDADTLAPLVMLKHTARVWHVWFSPDSTRIVTTSDDGAARVWNAHTGGLIFTSLDEPSDVEFAFMGSDGSKVALLYSDGRILVHAIAFDDVLEIAKGRVTRSLTDAECRTYLHLRVCAT